ncbi:hypothetical protein DH2020_045415 [Rehmannia glutinosa]|uniref:Uncharacterized protein n=1 Tax=Rehmannia glutinosa TaxID=99300 RepID=A0ABR0UEY2_REHGL
MFSTQKQERKSLLNLLSFPPAGYMPFFQCLTVGKTSLSAGKKVLVKSVLDALPVYVLSCFKLPIGTCQQIFQLAAKLWCWLSCRNTFKKEIRFEIGDDKSIQIRTPLDSLSDNFRTSTPSPDSFDLFWASELLDSDGNSWNIPLVEFFSIKLTVSIFLELKVCKMVKRQACLAFGKNGSFSVKSTYSQLVLDKVKNMDIAESSGNSKIMHTIRKRSCRGEQAETLEHIMFSALELKPSGSSLLFIGMTVMMIQFLSDLWWSKIRSLNKEPASENRIQLSTYILWWLWKTEICGFLKTYGKVSGLQSTLLSPNGLNFSPSPQDLQLLYHSLLLANCVLCGYLLIVLSILLGGSFVLKRIQAV